VSAALVHLVRHGEVHNPGGVLYGRIEGFGLSERGRRMAEAAAESLAGRPIAAVVASPLQRTRESAEPWIRHFGVELGLDPRLIEPTNRFEGLNLRRDLPRMPKHWPFLLNPWRPAWGEPFLSIANRMLAAVHDQWEVAPSGELVLVSHQLPIWMVARSVAGQPLAHDPRRRRCALSSITTLERRGDRFVEVGYAEPAAAMLSEAIDRGAV
jgi:broad specificity phosphatase PhoE